MTLNLDQIKSLIPHRFPFLFLDGVTAYQAGASIDGFKLVSIGEPFFAGHFPQQPVMPGMLITEAMAQLGCVFMALELGEDAKGKTPLFLGIESAKFRAPVFPGARLEMRLEVIQAKRGRARMGGKALVDGAVVAEADMLFMLR